MPGGKRHYRITLADALSAHERALTFGGRPGISNIGLVESAIARPYSGYYRPIAYKLAALVESMARNHGFSDGNKRTTVILMDLLLTKSGYELTAYEEEDSPKSVEEMVLSVVTHRIEFDGLVDWFSRRIRKQ